MTTASHRGANSDDRLDDWTPDPAELIYLGQFATERQCILAIGLADKVPTWIVGRAAGFAGSGPDEEVRKRNWMSSVSRATRKNGRVRPAIKTLQSKLKDFRKGNDGQRSFTRAQMLARCDFIIEHGSHGESLRAIQVKDALTGKERGGEVTGGRAIGQLVGEVGPERAARALREMGRGFLIYKYGELFPGIANATDTESRIERLEAGKHGRDKRGPVEGPVSGRIGDTGRDGATGISGNPSAGVGAEDGGGHSAPGSAGERVGKDRTQRVHPATRQHVGERLAEVESRKRERRRREGKRSPEREEADMRLFQRSIGLGGETS